MDFKNAPVRDDSAEQLQAFVLALFSAPEIVIGLAALVLVVGLAALRLSSRARSRRRRVPEYYY